MGSLTTSVSSCQMFWSAHKSASPPPSFTLDGFIHYVCPIRVNVVACKRGGGHKTGCDDHFSGPLCLGAASCTSLNLILFLPTAKRWGWQQQQCGHKALKHQDHEPCPEWRGLCKTVWRWITLLLDGGGRMTYRVWELACQPFQERKQRRVNPRCMSCVSGEIGFLVVSKDRESLVGETKKQKPKCVERFLPSLILLSLQMWCDVPNVLGEQAKCTNPILPIRNSCEHQINKLAKLKRCVRLRKIHFGNWNPKTVGHNFQKISHILWSRDINTVEIWKYQQPMDQPTHRDRC